MKNYLVLVVRQIFLGTFLGWEILVGIVKTGCIVMGRGTYSKGESNVTKWKICMPNICCFDGEEDGITSLIRGKAKVIWECCCILDADTKGEEEEFDLEIDVISDDFVEVPLHF